MKFDLKNLSRKELEKLQRDVSKALERVGEQEKKAALDAAEKAARAHGFSLKELTGAKTAGAAAQKPPASKPAGKKSGDGRAKVAPKFRNPADPEQTWSGRGRKPKWVEAHIAAGGSMDDVRL